MSRTISVAAATGLLDAIAASGATPEDVLRAVGLQRSVLQKRDAFIATSAFTALLSQASRSTGDVDFGLHFGERFDPRDIGALTYLVFNSPNVTIALQNVQRYLRIHNSAARVYFEVEGQHAYLRYVVAEQNVEPARQHNEYSMAVALKTLRILTATQCVPIQVQFAHEAPQSTLEHERVFACPVIFGGETNVLVMENEVIQHIVSDADERLYRILKQYVERLVAEMPREDNLLLAVRRAIIESMATGGPKREVVAQALAMSPRTLERRLKERGAVYKKLVSDVRAQFARDYLKHPHRTITEVAFLLGYSEVSAFNRAFKRGTGMTPMEYREHSVR